MSRSKIITYLLITLLVLAGCLSETHSREIEEIIEPEQVFESWDNHSHQFWNVVPMSVGNSSSLNTSGGDFVNITLELSAYFHEPVLWEQGYVNYTLTHNNDTVFTTILTHSQETYYVNLTNLTHNLTVTIQSTGSDDQTTPEPGDFFIATVNYRVFATLN
jgi:hypothetical protein